MMKIKQRRTGEINPKYHEAKAELERKAKKGHCIICGKKLPKFRRKYCSDKCFDNWFENFAPAMTWANIKSMALKRDNYTCVKCGFQHKGNKYYLDGELIIDHIKPIALGGEEFELDNVQTLCVKCNKIKTAKDLSRIAKLIRGVKK